MFRISIPAEAGNADARNGFAAMRRIIEAQKPEAAYFVAEGGKRTAVLIVNMDDLSELPPLAEPWFVALNASIECTPVMVVEDLMKAGPAMSTAIQTLAQA